MFSDIIRPLIGSVQTVFSTECTFQDINLVTSLSSVLLQYYEADREVYFEPLGTQLTFSEDLGPHLQIITLVAAYLDPLEPQPDQPIGNHLFCYVIYFPL